MNTTAEANKVGVARKAIHDAVNTARHKGIILLTDPGKHSKGKQPRKSKRRK